MAPSIENLTEDKDPKKGGRFFLNRPGADKLNIFPFKRAFQPGEPFVFLGGPQPERDHQCQIVSLEDGQIVWVRTDEDLFSRIE